MSDLPINNLPPAVLDEAHLGDIRGALGTIRMGDTGARRGWRPRLLTLLAILGPGLIVMVGDNDAGGFSTYTSCRKRRLIAVIPAKAGIQRPHGSPPSRG